METPIRKVEVEEVAARRSFTSEDDEESEGNSELTESSELDESEEESSEYSDEADDFPTVSTLTDLHTRDPDQMSLLEALWRNHSLKDIV